MMSIHSKIHSGLKLVKALQRLCVQERQILIENIGKEQINKIALQGKFPIWKILSLLLKSKRMTLINMLSHAALNLNIHGYYDFVLTSMYLPIASRINFIVALKDKLGAILTTEKQILSLFAVIAKKDQYQLIELLNSTLSGDAIQVLSFKNLLIKLMPLINRSNSIIAQSIKENLDFFIEHEKNYTFSETEKMVGLLKMLYFFTKSDSATELSDVVFSTSLIILTHEMIEYNSQTEQQPMLMLTEQELDEKLQAKLTAASVNVDVKQVASDFCLATMKPKEKEIWRNYQKLHF